MEESPVKTLLILILLVLLGIQCDIGNIRRAINEIKTEYAAGRLPGR
jgi:hypothetical protein